MALPPGPPAAGLRYICASPGETGSLAGAAACSKIVRNLSKGRWEMGEMKQSYTRPLVNRVELVLDQAVLQGCKTMVSGTGPSSLGGYDCKNVGTECVDQGS